MSDPVVTPVNQDQSSQDPVVPNLAAALDPTVIEDPKPDDTNKQDDAGTNVPADKTTDPAPTTDDKAGITGDAGDQDNKDQKPTELSHEEEINSLRGILRTQQRELAAMKAMVSRHEKIQQGNVGDKVEPEEYEALQKELASIAETRAESLNTLLEAMSLNPKYEDVNQVCSRRNLDELLELAASAHVQKNGGDLATVALQMEKEIWVQRNPYLYMYNAIKTYHPKYVQPEGSQGNKDDKDKGTTDAGTQKSGASTRPPAPANAPSSVAALGGGDGDIKGGWTAAKIDAMEETLLHTVPRDIYEKYLMGMLP